MSAVQIQTLITRQNEGSLTLPNKLIATLKHWRQRQRTRQQLDQLPAYLLKDIGMDRHTRTTESQKPFWQG